MSDYDPNYKPRKDYALLGQKAILSNEKGEILILQRSDKAGAGGKWSLPGGGLDRGEDPHDSIRREIREETQLEVENLRPFYARTYFGKDDDFVLILGYECTVINRAEPVLNWEHDQFKWLDTTSALNMDLTSDGRFFVEKYSQKQI